MKNLSQQMRRWFCRQFVRMHAVEFSLEELEREMGGINPQNKELVIARKLAAKGFDLHRPYLFQRRLGTLTYEAFQPSWKWRWCGVILPPRVLIEALPENP